MLNVQGTKQEVLEKINKAVKECLDIRGVLCINNTKNGLSEALEGVAVIVSDKDMIDDYFYRSNKDLTDAEVIEHLMKDYRSDYFEYEEITVFRKRETSELTFTNGQGHIFAILLENDVYQLVKNLNKQEYVVIRNYDYKLK